MSYIRYWTYSAGNVDAAVLADCAALFSRSYATWSNAGLRPGQPVKWSVAQLKANLLFDDGCGVVVATVSEDPRVMGTHVGHVCVRRFMLPSAMTASVGEGMCAWISQLCVAPEYRHQGIATNLIRVCTSSTDAVIALASSHPYAVRALERAQGRKVASRGWTLKHAPALIRAAAIPYLQDRTLVITRERCLIDTQFPIDHTQVDALVQNEGRRWPLGTLLPGHEFLALCPRQERTCTSRVVVLVCFLVLCIVAVWLYL